MKIQIINGPNINLLGKREPGIYGSQSFDDYLQMLKQRYPDVEIAYFQSNCEGNLIDKLQEVGFDADGIILNAGAYTHTSIALQDAIRAITAPVATSAATTATATNTVQLVDERDQLPSDALDRLSRCLEEPLVAYVAMDEFDRQQRHYERLKKRK